MERQGLCRILDASAAVYPVTDERLCVLRTRASLAKSRYKKSPLLPHGKEIPPPPPPPPNPSCVDSFVTGLGYGMCLATCIWAIVCFALDFYVAVTPYHLAVALLSLALLVWMKFGEWAMGERRQFYGRTTEVYVFLVGQWWLLVALMWAGIADYCQIRRAQETIEDNWFVLQTQLLIPFTTELDCKRNVEVRSSQLMVFSILTALLCLPMAADAWRALGGALHLLRARFAVMVLEFVPLLVIGVSAAAYAVVAAEVSAFATPDTTADLLWISAMAGLSIIALAMASSALTAWGSCFASHATLALLLPVPAIVMFSTSLWVQARAGEVVGFVSANWDTIRLYVPPAFSATPWKNYAYASVTPMLQAASLGLQFSVLALFSSIFHLWAALAMHSVGRDLEEESVAHNAEYERLMAFALGEEGAGGAAAARADAPLLGAGKGGYGTGGGSSSSSSSSSSGTGFGGGRAGGYGPLFAGSSEEVDGGEAQQGGSGGAASSELFLSVDLNTANSSKSRAAAKAQASPEARVLLERLDAVDRLRALPLVYAGKLNNLLDRVAVLPVGTAAALLQHDMRQLWGSWRTCIFLTLGVGFIGVMGMMGALIKVTHDGYCSRLVSRATGAKTLSFSKQVPIWAGGEDGPPPFTPFNPTSGKPVQVTVVHNYPLGSVEINATALDVSVIYDSVSYLTVDALYFAADARDLPSAAALNASLVVADNYIPGPCQIAGPCFGYAAITIVLSPPAGAADKCLGVRLRISIPVGDVLLNVTTISAAVSVSGNVDQLGTLTPTLYAVNVATDSAPVTMLNVFSDWRRTPGFVTPEVFSPSAYARSASGLLQFRNVFSAGIYGQSGGGVRFATAASICITPSPSVCGVVEGRATGKGLMGVSNLLAAREAHFFSDSGMIVAANVAALIGAVTEFASGSGNVYLSNFIQGAGNTTTVATAGNVACSAVFVNRLYVTTFDSGNVGMTVVFVGINSSQQLKFDLGKDTLDLPLLSLFYPPVSNYSLPLLAVNTNFGDISVISVGGNPAASAFADVLSIDFRSTDGAIKVELSGGGINADYSVSSGAASAVVEVDGQASPLVGHIGAAGSGNNSIFVRSERDVVQLSRAWGEGAPAPLPFLLRPVKTLLSLFPLPPFRFALQFCRPLCRREGKKNRIVRCIPHFLARQSNHFTLALQGARGRRRRALGPRASCAGTRRRLPRPTLARPISPAGWWTRPCATHHTMVLLSCGRRRTKSTPCPPPP